MGPAPLRQSFSSLLPSSKKVSSSLLPSLSTFFFLLQVLSSPPSRICLYLTVQTVQDSVGLNPTIFLHILLDCFEDRQSFLMSRSCNLKIREFVQNLEICTQKAFISLLCNHFELVSGHFKESAVNRASPGRRPV